MGWNGRKPSLDFGVGRTKLGKSVNMGRGGWTNNSEMTWAGVKGVQTYEAEFFMAFQGSSLYGFECLLLWFQLLLAVAGLTTSSRG